MKKAVMYGAGNIGRGFIGQLFSQSGYEVVFIDINTQLVNKINEYGRYPIRFASPAGNYEIIIENVRAVNGMDVDSVASEISSADIMATAVGVNILPRIAQPLARGLSLRWNNKNMEPLNIIICENMLDANHYLKALIADNLSADDKKYLEHLTGFVEASIGRMVPVVTPELLEGNALRVCVEEYGELPVDKEGFKGEIPFIKDMLPFSPFGYYIQRKLFIHNMGHAIAAYLGFMKGYKYIWESVEDRNIKNIVRGAMMESAQALSKEHGIGLKIIQEHVDDLLNRFGNRQLGDTIERVGKDLKRKLSPGDRLVGALNLCRKNGEDTINICTGIAAAMHFEEPSSCMIKEMIDNYGIQEVLGKVCNISRDSKEWHLIIGSYNGLKATRPALSMAL